MFTVEFEADAAVITTLDENDAFDDVQVVIGWAEDEQTYFAMSTGDAKAVLFALEEAKFMLMNQLLQYDD